MLTDTVYDRAVKKYSRDRQVMTALNTCLAYLPYEEDPARMGNAKSGWYKGAYGYNLSSSIRLIYKVDYENHEISLIIIGNHKEVYGHD